MIARNEFTGDQLITAPANDAYRDGWTRIFGGQPTTRQVPVNAPDDAVGDFDIKLLPGLIHAVQLRVNESTIKKVKDEMASFQAEKIAENTPLTEKTFELETAVYDSLLELANTFHLSDSAMLTLLLREYLAANI